MEWHDIFPTNIHVKLHHLCKKWFSITSPVENGLVLHHRLHCSTTPMR